MLSLTLAVFLATGAMVALAAWGVVPEAALLAGAPAIAGAMLVDTFLYNALLLRVGAGFWLLCYAFLFVQSLALAALATWGYRRLTERDGDGSPR